MHSSLPILALLTILLATGCATVEPYPPVSRDQNPGSETELALINDQQAPAAGIRKRAHHKPVHHKPSDQRRIELHGGEFWQLLREDFRLSGTRHKAVSKRAALYSENPRQVERVLKQGEPYLAYIRYEVEKRNFPAEVVLLPFIESGYDPFAFSPGRAAGLWQFIPSTGKYFGLKQDWWYDERRDVIASTNAALNYLDKLQNEFNGDWLLAFAAYNAGGGTIRNAIKRNRKAGKPTDFWRLELPKETTGYVPKLLAISRIVDKPWKYGVLLPAIDSTPGFAVVATGQQLDLVVAAELAEMEADAFYRINPGFNRWATHPDGPHQLAIPADKADSFSKNLAELHASERSKWIRHKVASGETLGHIAQRYRTTVKVLKQSNNMRSTSIRAGSHLLVPVAAKDTSDYATMDTYPQYSDTSASSMSHQVETGDSLWAIAHRHQVTVAKIKEWNQLDAGSLIKPGQQLVIWKDSLGAPAGKQVRTIYYTVRNGDSLYGISKKYNVSITDLQRWNNIHKDAYLQPGQSLKILVDVTRLTMK